MTTWEIYLGKWLMVSPETAAFWHVMKGVQARLVYRYPTAVDRYGVYVEEVRYAHEQ